MGKHFVVLSDSEEYDNDHILQIVSKARLLANKTEGMVTVLCIGTENFKMFENLLHHGANRVLYSLSIPTNIKSRIDIFEEMLSVECPDVILVPATFNGKNIAASLSVKLNAGLTADCVDIQYVDDKVHFYRGAMSSSVIAKIICINCDIYMGTVKLNTFEKKIHSNHEITGWDQFITKKEEYEVLEHWRVLERIRDQRVREVDIFKYKIIFCIGRGVKNLNIYNRIEKLAQFCNAGIVGTGPVVDKGYIENSRKVGQSGKSIAPDIYISFGVSGATQHIVGIKNAKLVIAINHDRNARIFDYADYSIVAEVEEVITELENLLLSER